MLVLTRDVGEKFILSVDGKDIATITYLQTKGRRIRVGIEADQLVHIRRSELQPKVTNEQHD